jgi:hypothetical protein
MTEDLPHSSAIKRRVTRLLNKALRFTVGVQYLSGEWRCVGMEYLDRLREWPRLPRELRRRDRRTSI